jgi:short-subunit dehydrogenase
VLSLGKEYYTLITGASLGIGRALARECAGRNMNLILIALDDEQLRITAHEIGQAYKVDVRYMGIDLTKAGAAKAIYTWCQDHNLKINILINNAGVGTSGLFEKEKISRYLYIMDLNTRALMQMTYYFLPSLKKQSNAFILNVSSMEATLPLPYKAVYTATKSFIYAFSLALREELSEFGVRVCVLCPGSVITTKGGLERAKVQGAKAKLVILSAEEVAQTAIHEMLAGKRVIIPGFFPRLIVRIMNALPTRLKMFILNKIFSVYKSTTRPQELIIQKSKTHKGLKEIGHTA